MTTVSQTTIGTAARRVWKSAQLYIGFHRDQEGRKRDKAKVWPPKNGNASINPNPAEQEAFVLVKGTGSALSGDVEVKFRSDKIVVRRDSDACWQGVQIDPGAVIVRTADNVYIKIGYDGSVTRSTDEDETTVEADGSVFKRTEYTQAYMSPDGSTMETATPNHRAEITENGVRSSLDDGWRVE